MAHSHAPIAGWMSTYRRSWFGTDAVAGLTAAAVVIPKAMAYAVIAGLAVEAGLYTALAAMVVYPLLGSSRPLNVSVTSAIAMLTGAQVVAASTNATGAEAATIAATLAMLVGVVLIVARLFRMGFLANLVSLPVLVGFEAGVGAVIIIGQLPAMLGVHTSTKQAIGTLRELPGLLPEVNAPTLAVAVAGVVLLQGLHRIAPRVPNYLVWVAVSIAASAAFGLEAMGVETLGSVPSGLPRLVAPDLSLAGALWPGALAIALMSFTESVAAARTFATRDDPPVVPNRELVALGAANVAAAFVGGMPSGGGTSQTAVVQTSGAHSQMAQWVSAAAVLMTLLFLSPLLALMPKAALGALILVASLGMIKPKSFRAIARIRRLELTWALVTLAGVIVIGTLEGILIAVAISVFTLMVQANHPPVYEVAYNRAMRVFRRAGEDDEDETVPGLLILRTEGRLTFANADRAAEKMRALITEKDPEVIVLECSAIPDIEYTALVKLTEAEERMRARGVSLWLAALNPDLLQRIRAAPLGEALGNEKLFFNLHKVMEAWEARSQGART